MLAYRSLLVYPLSDDKYIIIGGNMRFRAMQDLGHKEAPCVIIPKETTVDRLKAYTILDNNGFGQWDWDLLANEWPEDLLGDWGLDTPMDWGLEEPTDLDEEKSEKPMVAKITFQSDKDLERFQSEYSRILQDQYNCSISVSGGKL